MKIESLRDVKANLSNILKKLPSERSVVITKNGRPCAVLFPVTNETDLEGLLLSQRKDFREMLDRAHKEGEKKALRSLKICLADESNLQSRSYDRVQDRFDRIFARAASLADDPAPREYLFKRAAEHA